MRAHASWVPELGERRKLLPSTRSVPYDYDMVPQLSIQKIFRHYFITSRISPAAAITLSTSRESALACWVA
jgi:hypothetical protein